MFINLGGLPGKVLAIYNKLTSDLDVKVSTRASSSEVAKAADYTGLVQRSTPTRRVISTRQHQTNRTVAARTMNTRTSPYLLLMSTSAYWCSRGLRLLLAIKHP